MSEDNTYGLMLEEASIGRNINNYQFTKFDFKDL